MPAPWTLDLVPSENFVVEIEGVWVRSVALDPSQRFTLGDLALASHNSMYGSSDIVHLVNPELVFDPPRREGNRVVFRLKPV